MSKNLSIIMILTIAVYGATMLTVMANNNETSENGIETASVHYQNSNETTVVGDDNGENEISEEVEITVVAQETVANQTPDIANNEPGQVENTDINDNGENNEPVQVPETTAISLSWSTTSSSISTASPAWSSASPWRPSATPTSGPFWTPCAARAMRPGSATPTTSTTEPRRRGLCWNHRRIRGNPSPGYAYMMRRASSGAWAAGPAPRGRGGEPAGPRASSAWCILCARSSVCPAPG